MKRNIIFTAIILATLVFTGCRDKQEAQVFTFEASIDQPVSHEKVDMLNERYIYFQKGDKISVASDQGNTGPREAKPLYGTLNDISSGSGSGQYNGVFTTTLNEASRVFCAVYPQNNDIEISYDKNNTTFNAQCWFPRVQEYVSDETFGKLSYPMVAFSNKQDGYLEFHALCGIVRIQFYAPANEGFAIDSIQITSDSKNLSGFFKIKDLKEHVPYVDPSTTGLTGSRTVSIKCTTPVSANNLCSFYLTLPAFDDQIQLYNDLKMKLYGKTNDGTKTSYTLETKLSAYVGPRNITRMNAINVNDWIKYDEGNTDINPSGISGNGTEIRPFEIYYASDLAKIRDAFNTPNGTLNGIAVQSNNYYYKIMRDDIVLNTTNWNAGINNFRGTMIYERSSSSTMDQGITNISEYPLFNSISANGTIKDITIKGNNTTLLMKYSPLCQTNNGTIEGCHIENNYKCTSVDANSTIEPVNLGGICYENKGTIKQCYNSGSFDAGTTKNVASVCYINNGTIKNCNITNVKLAGKEIGGICHTNNKTIESCIFSAQMGANLTCDFGGIAFKQTSTDAKIQKCNLQQASQIKTTGNIGGIVNTMTGGVLDYCGNTTQYGLGGTYSGGIVSQLIGGTVKNCYCDMAGYTNYASGNGTNYCGGIAGLMQSGTITNCFSTASVSAVGSVSGYAGTIVGHLTGGTINNCCGWDYGAGYTDQANDDIYGLRQNNAGTITYCWSRGDGTSNNEITYFVDATANMIDELNAHKGDGMSWYLKTTSGSSYPDLVASAKKAKNRRLNRTK